MCVSPSDVWVTRGGLTRKEAVPCRRCWRCVENRVSQYVGRGLCESAYSTATWAATLTYAERSDGYDQILFPRHAQNFIRALRKRGHNVRYVVAGEHGSQKGRAHFHAVLFFRGDLPDWRPLDDGRVWCETWPHGHIHLQKDASDRALRYCLKYLQKDTTDKAAQSWMSLSKKPILGAQFIADRAAILAEQGLWPRSFNYLPPRGQVQRPYYLQGAARSLFLGELLRLHGGPPKGFTTFRDGPLSEIVARHLRRYMMEPDRTDCRMELAQADAERMAEELADRQRKASREAQERFAKHTPEDRYRFWLMQNSDFLDDVPEDDLTFNDDSELWG